MPESGDGAYSTLQRRLLMLSLIPRAPRKIGTPDLGELLSQRGIRVSQRTIQRDLERLQGLLPLVVDDRERPYGWQWMKNGRVIDIPALDPEAALTLKVMDAHAAALLPPTARAYMAPHIQRADQVLKAAGKTSGLKLWPDRVRVLPGGPPLKTPPLKKGVFTAVQQALFEHRCIDMVYSSRVRGGERMNYRVHPLALVFREPVTYLVGTINDYDDPRHLALHRIEKVTITDEPVAEPGGSFDFDAYLATGPFEYPEGDDIELELRLNNGVAYHLRETPLADDQELEPTEDETIWHLRATVQDTARLRWWLRGFGSGVEVLKPEHIRTEFAEDAAEMAQQYGRASERSPDEGRRP